MLFISLSEVADESETPIDLINLSSNNELEVEDAEIISMDEFNNKREEQE